MQFFVITVFAQKDTMNSSGDSLTLKMLTTLTSSSLLPKNESEELANSKKLHVLTNKNIPLDSSRLNFAKLPLKHDSTKMDIKNLTVRKDSAVKKEVLLKKLKTVLPKGTLSLGYDYGFLPYTVNMPSPASAIKTEGSIETSVFNIPLDITYFYSTQKNLVGLNNYFRISYNADRYKSKLSTKLAGNVDAYKGNLSNLTTQKQQLMQKMAYTDYLSSISPDKWPIDTTSTKAPKLKVPHIKTDTSNLGIHLPNFDSTKTKGLVNQTDTIKNNKYYTTADSIAQQAIVYKNKADSVKRTYSAYQKDYEVLNDSIKKVQSKINELERLTDKGNAAYINKLPYFNNIQNFLSGIKKFDLGLCYPAYSTFLTNNIPVRGINVEYQKNNRFFAFTYGTTVSTLLYSNRNVDGFLQNLKNSYNYFDANNLSAGRKILSAKFGVGEKESNHFFVGFLIGKGVNTSFPGRLPEATSTLIESNFVLEAEARKKLGKNTVLDVVLGKSSLQEADLNMASIQTASKELFSNFRSYALLVKLKTNLAATKSNITCSVRWIDPFFNSFGIGFMRSDNMRYEIKLDQPLGKRVSYSLMLRYEEDNLLKLLNYKNTFFTINNMLSYKIKRGLMLRVGYTPIIRSLNGEIYNSKSKSSIITSIVTYTPKSKNVQKQFNLLYNYYLVNTDTTPINFQNFTYYHQISFKNGFKTGLNVSWFKNNLKDTLSNNTFLAVLDVGYQFKNGSSFGVAGKSSYKLNGQFYPGFIIKSTAKLSNMLFWDNQVEKFIVGDLFNGYELENLKRFPYCYTTKLIFNF